MSYYEKLKVRNLNMTSLFMMRIMQEWHLLKYYWWKILVAFILTMYFCAVVARNVAFMHHRPISYYVLHENDSLVRKRRLEDFGFNIIPDWSSSKLAKGLNEFFATFTVISLIIFSNLTILLKRATQRKVFTTNIIVRFVLCYITVHLCRTFSYLTTVLPGPALHCINPQIEKTNKPKCLHDIFLSMHFNNNCGDLVYSGHMAGYVTGMCTLVYYTEKIFGKDQKLAKHHRRPALLTSIVLMFYVIGMLFQVVLVIGTRQHYTVDTLLAIVAGYWNFVWHLYVLRPADMDVPKSVLKGCHKATRDRGSKRDEDANKITKINDNVLTKHLLFNYTPG